MARQTFSGLEGDYTMSVAIALPGVGALDQYCWAYGFSNGTEQYVGLVNSPDNTGWYYTIKDGESADAPSHGGLSYGEWHHIAYVQEGNMGRLYVDGRMASEQQVTQRPADMAQELTELLSGVRLLPPMP